ncbi:DUF368 domain-containing protein [Marinobacter mobilis]|uniref:DUF368 domain-containing protein n=1 Tax=Marinobacter mobilis TaxID=488533 RepID=UPI0035C72388
MNESDETGRHQRLPGIFVRGMAMGAADVVPGVSGGTIAFITGIYFRLLAAVNAVPVAIVTELFRGRLREFWDRCDGTFLVCLLAGILTSVVTLASVITYVLAEFPVLIWSFFFGLIVASVWHVFRQVRQREWSLLLPVAAGAAFAWWITALPAGEVSPSALVFLASGALAICAMILPGISGSFILLIIGMYAPVLAAIKGGEIGMLALFAAGCVIGLLSIARVLTWAIHHHHDRVLAVLTGFMVGALNKVWPWKETLSWRVNSHGEQVPLVQNSISPMHYADLTGVPSQLMLAILCAFAGFALVLLIEWLGQRGNAPVKV